MHMYLTPLTIAVYVVNHAMEAFHWCRNHMSIVLIDALTGGSAEYSVPLIIKGVGDLCRKCCPASMWYIVCVHLKDEICIVGK